MTKRVIDLGRGKPLLDIASYGRAGPASITRAELELIDRTVRRSPEVVVKVSGGARTLAGVEGHLRYIGRSGRLALESDSGERVGGKGIESVLIEDWNLDLEARARRTQRSIRTARRPPKLVHNLIFSMPAGTPPKLVHAPFANWLGISLGPWSCPYQAGHAAWAEKLRMNSRGDFIRRPL
jgi:hypothetical protein